MKGITFGNYHSYNDFSLILKSKEIGSQEVKEKKIDIEGADGFLDFTDIYGEPKYGNVQHKFNFSTIVPQSEFLSLYSTVKNAIHGKKLRVILDDDPLFFYVGRCFVSKFTDEKNVGIISIETDCEPWKYKQDVTAVQFDVDGSLTVTLQNSRKRVVPLITTFSDMSFTFDGVTYSHEAGVFEIPEIELKEGENEITINGTGNVRFTYQEGEL